MHYPESRVYTSTGEIDLTGAFTESSGFIFDPAPANDESLFEILIAVAEGNGRPNFADEFRRRALEAKSRASVEEPEPTPVIREIRQ